MCSSDKQNMANDIENLLDIVLRLPKQLNNIKGWFERKGMESNKKSDEINKKRKEIEKKTKEIEKLVKDLEGLIDNGECSDSTSMGKPNEAKNCGKANDYFRDIRHVRNVVDLSVTGLTMDSLKDFWRTLNEFHNLTRLSVAVTDQSVIELPDSKNIPKKLKEKLQRLRMEGQHSGLEKLSEFRELNHLTLASHKKMDVGKIPNLQKLFCLRLYGVCDKEDCKSGVCKNATCEFELKLLSKLKKLVIGNMGKVKTVQISSAVLKRVATLKFSDLPKLEEVKYIDKPQSRLSWENKTIILRNSGDFPVATCPGLEIYKYNKEMQCYRLKENPKQ